MHIVRSFCYDYYVSVTISQTLIHNSAAAEHG
jgi:hypothetical protein